MLRAEHHRVQAAEIIGVPEDAVAIRALSRHVEAPENRHTAFPAHIMVADTQHVGRAPRVRLNDREPRLPVIERVVGRRQRAVAHVPQVMRHSGPLLDLLLHHFAHRSGVLRRSMVPINNERERVLGLRRRSRSERHYLGVAAAVCIPNLVLILGVSMKASQASFTQLPGILKRFRIIGAAQILVAIRVTRGASDILLRCTMPTVLHPA